MTRLPKIKPCFQVGAAKAPALSDPIYATEKEALDTALANAAEEVICIWNEIGETLWLVYQDETFKRAS